jgi:hypothetical protein
MYTKNSDKDRKKKRNNKNKTNDSKPTKKNKQPKKRVFKFESKSTTVISLIVKA